MRGVIMISLLAIVSFTRVNSRAVKTLTQTGDTRQERLLYPRDFNDQVAGFVTGWWFHPVFVDMPKCAENRFFGFVLSLRTVGNRIE